MYFFDPRSGRGRRHRARDRAGGLVRRFRGRIDRRVAGARARAQALVAKATHPYEQPKDLNDVTLADKVKSEVLHPPVVEAPHHEAWTG